MKKSFVPISKQSKKAQKTYHSAQRSTWGILNPATRTMPNGKAYYRKKQKAHDRSGRESSFRFPTSSFLSVPAYQSHRFRKYFVISSMPCFGTGPDTHAVRPLPPATFPEISTYSGTSLIIYNRCVCSRSSLAISSSVFSFFT